MRGCACGCGRVGGGGRPPHVVRGLLASREVEVLRGARWKEQIAQPVALHAAAQSGMLSFELVVRSRGLRVRAADVPVVGYTPAVGRSVAPALCAAHPVASMCSTTRASKAPAASGLVCHSAGCATVAAPGDLSTRVDRDDARAAPSDVTLSRVALHRVVCRQAGAAQVCAHEWPP